MLVDEVIGIAREAGKMMSSAKDVKVSDKGGKDNHVTDMDVAIQEYLRERLTGLVPGSSFVGEEGDCADRSGECYWIVDPIDGTTNFIRNLQMSVTAISLVKDDEVALGVVYNPFTDEMYHAVKGEGAFRNGETIRVSDRDVAHSLFATSWNAYDKRESRRSFNVTNRMFFICEDIRRTGSAAYEICKVAEGSIDMYFEPALQPWDHAAASIILAEAGGCMEGIDGRPSLRRMDRVAAANRGDSLGFLSMIIREEYSD